MLHALAIENYRSCKDLVLPLGQLTLVTGPNGSGKSNLYRALRLLGDVAHGQAVSSLAREGGLASVQWAGPEEVSRRMKRGEVPVQGSPRRNASAVRVGFIADDFSYAIDFGVPIPGRTAFGLDPEIKRESIWHGDLWDRRTAMVERRNALIEGRDGDGAWSVLHDRADLRESLLTSIADPHHAPEAFALRSMLRGWRFYDHFRTDRDAPARSRHIGTFTPALSHDGRDLAAALQTILEIGSPDDLAAAVDDAFPHARVTVQTDERHFGLAFAQPGLLRTLDETELSDGTLRYLLWVAALLTPRPPPLMVLNEPETSLHPDLLAPLGRLILAAAERTQVWVVSHAPPLIEVLRNSEACAAFRLDRELGATRVLPEPGAPFEAPPWRWPSR